MKRNILLIDGNYLLFKSYFATAKKNKGIEAIKIKTKSGFPTNAILVFLKTMFRITKTLKITHLLIAFDSEYKSFRHKIYEGYKGKRQPTPEELRQQIPVIKRIWEKLNIAWIEKKGLEADDIIASYVNRFKNAKNNSIFIFTEDKDLGQLVSKNVTMVNVVKGRLTFLGHSNFYKQELYHPWQVCDYKALVGDTSDNIKGVGGVGKITARKLLTNFLNIEEIYQNLHQLTPRLQKILDEHKQQVFDTKALVRLVIDNSLFSPVVQERFRLSLNKEESLEILREFELFGLLRLVREF